MFFHKFPNFFYSVHLHLYILNSHCIILLRKQFALEKAIIYYLYRQNRMQLKSRNFELKNAFRDDAELRALR